MPLHARSRESLRRATVPSRSACSPRTLPVLRSAMSAAGDSETRAASGRTPRAPSRDQPRDRSRWTMCVYSCAKTSSQPVVRVADQFRARRGGGADGDGVIGNRRRPAVGQLRLIDQDDVRSRLHRHAERRLQPEPRLLRDSRHPGGQAFLSAMKVDDEVLGRDRPEAQPWIESGRRGQRSGGQHRDDQAN